MTNGADSSQDAEFESISLADPTKQDIFQGSSNTFNQHLKLFTDGEPAPKKSQIHTHLRAPDWVLNIRG
jgi:hypothetical protein